MSTFSAWIKRERQRQDITQAELAARCGVSEAYLSVVERGFKPPSEKLVETACEVLGGDSDAIFLEQGKVPPDLRKEIARRGIGEVRRLRKDYGMRRVTA